MPADCDSQVIVELSDLEPFEPFEADLKPTPSLTGPMATPHQMCCDVLCRWMLLDAEQSFMERKHGSNRSVNPRYPSLLELIQPET